MALFGLLSGQPTMNSVVLIDGILSVVNCKIFGSSMLAHSLYGSCFSGTVSHSLKCRLALLTPLASIIAEIELNL